MDDQRFARKYVQRRRRIEIASRAAPVGRRAADHLILEKQKVLDGRGYRIESCPALPRGKPNFEDAVLARQRYRLSELWPNCGICSSLGTLRPGGCAGASKHQRHSEGGECQQAKQAPCAERFVEWEFVHARKSQASDFYLIAETKSFCS